MEKMETPLLPFFSAADRQLEHLISFNEFEKSLYLNILFQGGVLIPDNFIFVSSYIDQHISRFSRASLFEAALENGLIIPSFRNQKRVDFHDVLFELQGAGKPETAVHGIRHNAKEIATRLQLSADRGKDYKYKIWPQYSVGGKFKAFVLDHLTGKDVIELPDNARFDKEEIQELWEQTTTFRNDVILEAITASSKIQTSGPGPGLRRGEIYDTVGRWLGLDVPKQGVDDIRFLLSAVEGNERDYKQLSHFLGWVNECYHLNLARSLGSVPNSPNFLPPTGLMYESSLPAGPQSIEGHEFDVIETTVEFPSLEMLGEISGKELVAIVKDVGQGYHAARMDWQSDPSASNQQRVHDLIHQYSKELNKCLLNKYGYVDKANLEVVFGKMDSRDRIMVETIIKILEKGIETIPVIGSALGLIFEIRNSFFVAHKLSKAEPTLEKIKLVSKRKSAEVNFPDSKD